ILTDVEGLYDADPRTHSKAKLIRRVESIDGKLLSAVGSGAGSHRGTGGMYSKLKAADEATSEGIETWLVKGDIPSVLVQVAKGAKVGTQFIPRKRGSHKKSE